MTIAYLCKLLQLTTERCWKMDEISQN